MFSLLLLACLFLAARSGEAQPLRIDTTTLPQLLDDRGFERPEQFKALVVEITLTGEGKDRTVATERWFDYRGTSLERDWHPASTVKLYAALAALRKLAELHVDPQARVVFTGIDWHGEWPRVRDVVARAIGPSDNLSYTLLMNLAGYDFVHRHVLGDLLGLSNTELNPAYDGRLWARKGGNRSLHVNPEVTLRGRRRKCTDAECPRTVVIPAREGTPGTICPEKTCTTLHDLAQAMRRLMLQDELYVATRESPGGPLEPLLPDYAYWKVVVRALKGYDRPRGNSVRWNLQRGFYPKKVAIYSKPGYAGKWFSEVLYVLEPHSNRRWVVVLAGYPGWHCIDDAALHIGRILATGDLARARHVTH